ncbi:MAG: VOC family protein [Frankia sp.]|nr:VOC family protein [Frankia sp.]
MPAPDFSVAGLPIWVDLSTSDTDVARSFYGQLFGWTSEAPDPAMGGYFNFWRDGGPVAGGMPTMPEQEVTNVWSIYLLTDDAKKTAAAVAEHGGEVLVAPMAVSDLGVMAVYKDAAGAVIGAWQPGAHRGYAVRAEPNAPDWFELHTSDYKAAVRFYQDAFGWNVRTEADEPDFRYTTLVDATGEQYAGIMDASGFLPEGEAGGWRVYFASEDTDATVAKAVELGGKVILPAEDTPYGRLAELADPLGAVFKLRGPNKG